LIHFCQKIKKMLKKMLKKSKKIGWNKKKIYFCSVLVDN